MMVMITAYYLIAFDLERDPFYSRRDGIIDGNQEWAPNSVDKYVFDFMTPLRVRLARILGIGSSARYRNKLERIFITVSFPAGVFYPYTSWQPANTST